MLTQGLTPYPGQVTLPQKRTGLAYSVKPMLPAFETLSPETSNNHLTPSVYRKTTVEGVLQLVTSKGLAVAK